MKIDMNKLSVKFSEATTAQRVEKVLLTKANITEEQLRSMDNLLHLSDDPDTLMGDLLTAGFKQHECEEILNFIHSANVEETGRERKRERGMGFGPEHKSRDEQREEMLRRLREGREKGKERGLEYDR